MLLIYLTGMVMMLWMLYIGARERPETVQALGNRALPSAILVMIFWPIVVAILTFNKDIG